MQYVTDVIHWLEEHAALSSALVVASIVMLVGTLWAGHRFLTTIPADFFRHEHKRFALWQDSHPVWRWSVIVAKNLLGGLLILAGLVMLITPGQGVLSILLGLALVDVPGKRTLERKILQRPTVLKLVNRLRARSGQPPLEF